MTARSAFNYEFITLGAQRDNLLMITRLLLPTSSAITDCYCFRKLKLMYPVCPPGKLTGVLKTAVPLATFPNSSE